MSGITVRQIQQKIVVDGATGAVSVIATGPQGPAGPPGNYPLTLSDDAPASPTADDLWIRTTDFVLLVYFNDGDSMQWVEVGSINAADIDLAALADELVPYILNDPDFEEGSGSGGTSTPPTVKVSTDTHTLTLANKATMTLYSHADQVVVTVPTDLFEDGDWFTLQSIGAGGLTLDLTGLTVNGDTPNQTIEQNQTMTVMFTDPNTVSILGGTSE